MWSGDRVPLALLLLLLMAQSCGDGRPRSPRKPTPHREDRVKAGEHLPGGENDGSARIDADTDWYTEGMQLCLAEGIESDCYAVCRTSPYGKVVPADTVAACDRCCACGFSQCCTELAAWYVRGEVVPASATHANHLRQRAKALAAANGVDGPMTWKIWGKYNPRAVCTKRLYGLGEVEPAPISVADHCEVACEIVLESTSPRGLQSCVRRCIAQGSESN